MLQKVKDALEARKISDEVISQLEAHQKNIQGQSTAIEDVNKRIKEMTDVIIASKGHQQELMQMFQHTNEASLKLKDELTSNVVNIQVLKSQLQNHIAEKVQEQIEELTDQFRGKVNHIGELENELTSLTHEVVRVRSEVAKFTAISTRLREADFQLNNYAKRLKENDAEKLELMRKIDTLERLVSKMRRQR